jgi:hypothetical protein
MLGVGVLLAPVEAPARGGGFMAGRAGFAHGAFHSFVGQSFVQPRPAPAPGAIQGHGFRIGSAALAPRLRFRRFFGTGLPLAGIGITYGGYDYYGGYGDQIAEAGAYGQPVYYPAADNFIPVPQAGYPFPSDRGVCRSQTLTVPSEAGGQRKVTITRC